MYPNKKIYLKGVFTLQSALKIASGKGFNTDSDVVLDARGKPFIPGTSLAGKLYRELLNRMEPNDNDIKELNKYWGRDENGRNSFIDVSNGMLCSDADIFVRDGIAIDYEKRQTLDKSKYDYEVVPAGASFSYCIVIDVYDDLTEKTGSLIDNIIRSGISIGGKTSKGLGLLKADESKCCHKILDLKNNIQDVKAFLTNNICTASYFNPIKTNEKKPEFQITAAFQIAANSSLIIGEESDGEADKQHIREINMLFKGTSVYGALKSHAIKLCNTFGKDISIVEDVFGSTKKEKDDKDTKPSLLKINEVCVENPKSDVQKRICIDRFTGGTIESKLFDSEPLFAGEIKHFTMSMNKKPKNDSLALILLVFADMYNGTIRFGGEHNVGRGRLKGISASVSFDGKDYSIPENNLSVDIKDFDKIIDDFLKKTEKTEA